MSANLTDFPPGRKKPWPSSECPAPAKGSRSPAAVASAPPSPRSPLLWGREHAYPGRGRSSGPASTARSQDHRDLALRAPAGLRQADRFLLKSLRKPSLLGHRVPHSSLGTLHFSKASPPHLRDPAGPAEPAHSEAAARLLFPALSGAAPNRREGA